VSVRTLAGSRRHDNHPVPENRDQWDNPRKRENVLCDENLIDVVGKPAERSEGCSATVGLPFGRDGCGIQ